MKNRNAIWLGVVMSLVIAPICRGQAPAIPGAPVTPAAPGNLWSFLLPNADQKANCKSCFCNSPIGMLLNGGGGAFSTMSGGLITNRCAKFNLMEDLKKPAESAEGAAARVKKDEEEAKARRAAVRYLGTVDCNYWPEAVETLKLSLRGDRNECVRFEAALALGNGCCCNNEIIKALEMCITGSDKDGFPPERSDRVRAAAADALARCPLMIPEPEIEKKKEVTESGPVNPKDYYKKIASMPRAKVASSARAVLVSLNKGERTPAANGGTTASLPAVGPIPAIHQRPTSLSGIFTSAFAGDSGPATPGGVQSREPFFSNLTRTLTGRQDYANAPRNSYLEPMPGTVITLQERNSAVPAEIVAPAPVFTPAPRTEAPKSLPRESKTTTSGTDMTFDMWIKSTAPAAETKVATPTLVIIQPEPSGVRAPMPVRESREPDIGVTAPLRRQLP